jgi:UDP-N-acetylglucosamine 4,6-dehydratase
MIFDNSTVLVTGGSGSFGKAFVKTILKHSPVKVIVFSRDELKQYEMSNEIRDDRVVYFVGDVRDASRLYRAFDGVDFVVHCAALKQIPSCEYNPFEAIQTNVIGAKNIIDAAIDRGVSRIIALSTDKACGPINLYGATKLCSDKLFVAGNSYSGKHRTRFAGVRYGNVVGSRGSVIPFFKRLAIEKKPIPITDRRMTRFWITLDQGVEFVIQSMERMMGGEIFIPKIPSMRLIDLAEAIAPACEQEIVGIRPGEKLHEIMISEDDATSVMDYESYYAILPTHHSWCQKVNGGKPVSERFRYSSDTNTQWLSIDELRRLSLC